MFNILIIIFLIYPLIKSKKITYSVMVLRVPLLKAVTEIKFQCLTIGRFNCFIIFKLMKEFSTLLSSRVLIGVPLIYIGKIKYCFMN